jgi:hypothetical protein
VNVVGYTTDIFTRVEITPGVNSQFGIRTTELYSQYSHEQKQHAIDPYSFFAFDGDAFDSDLLIRENMSTLMKTAEDRR